MKDGKAAKKDGKEVVKGKAVKEVSKEVAVDKEPTDYELLVKLIQEKSEEKLSKNQVKSVISLLPEVITDVLQANGSVRIKGLMTASLVLRTERAGFDIASKKKITIPEQIGIHLKPTSALKDFAKGVSVKEFNKKFAK